MCNRFVRNYFNTIEGVTFVKAHPRDPFTRKERDKELLEELQDLGKTLEGAGAVDKNLRINDLGKSLIASQLSGNGTQYMDGTVEDEDRDQYLNHEDQLPDPDNEVRGSFNKSKSFRIKSGKVNKVSIATMIEKQRIEENKIKREKDMQYHFQKSMRFNVYGTQRKNLPDVKSLYKSNPQTVPNERYIKIEAPVDRRVKVCSMNRRMFIQAPGVEEIRKDADHKKMMTLKDKGYDEKTLTEKKSLMSISAMHDGMQKDIVVYPERIDFGNVEAGSYYETKILIKNEDSLLQRIKIVQPDKDCFSVYEKQRGAIAMGMSKELKVIFKPRSEDEGYFDDSFKIISKYRIYTIPIEASIGDKGKEIHEIMSQSKYGNTALEKSLKYPIKRKDFVEHTANLGGTKNSSKL